MYNPNSDVSLMLFYKSKISDKHFDNEFFFLGSMFTYEKVENIIRKTSMLIFYCYLTNFNIHNQRFHCLLILKECPACVSRSLTIKVN